MSLKSTLLIDENVENEDEKMSELKDENDQEKSTEKSISSSSSRESLDYASQFYFYYQAGQMHTDGQPVAPPLQVILPNGDICLGYSYGHKMSDQCDIIDGNVWLFRPRSFNPIHRLYYIRLALSIIIVVDIILVLLTVFADLNIHFNIRYNGGNCSFVVLYYTILLLSMIGCTFCVWKHRLSWLSIFSSSLITDAIVSCLWNEHLYQFTHWALQLINVGLLALYFSYSFGKWNLLPSQSRIDELERLQQNSEF